MAPSIVLFRLLPAGLRVWVMALAALLVVERALLVGAAYLALTRPLGGVAKLGVAVAIVFAVRGAARGVLRAGVQRRLHGAVLDALLDGDVLRGAPIDDQDAHAAILDGVLFGSRVLSDLIPDFFGEALAAAAFTVVVVVTQPARVVGVGAVALVLGAAGVLWARRITAVGSDRAWHAYVPVHDDLLAALGGRVEIVGNGRRPAFGAEARQRLERWATVSAASERLSALAGRAPVVAASVGVAGALLLDGSLRGTLTGAGVVDAAVLAAVVPSFFGVARTVHEMVRTSSHVRSLAEILESVRAADTGSRATPAALPADIRWDDVHFAYPPMAEKTSPLVLTGTTIAWPKDKVLVVAGPNGSGKSTLFRLLVGLARPTRGAVRVGDGDLSSIDLDAWRSRIAYLPQRPFLPDRATVGDAMRLLAPSATDDDARGALARAGLWDALAASSEAPLAVRIGTLSAGQRQRVALARVLVVDAPLVIFDEPDANLDADGVASVKELVRELAKTKMVAVVAHTPELLDLGDAPAGVLVTLPT